MGDEKDPVVRLVRDAVNQKVDVPQSRPPDSSMGDTAVPCFQLARQLDMDAVPLAERIRDHFLQQHDRQGIARVEAHGPYLNVFLAKGELAARVINEILKKGDRYGARDTGRDKCALVEHTSINPNAPPHLGRARNAWIGDTLVRLLRFEGYGVETRFFVNDVGRQIALLVLGVGDRSPDFRELLQIYVATNQQLEQQIQDLNEALEKIPTSRPIRFERAPELQREVNYLLESLEQGDEQTRKKFRKVVKISVDGMERLFHDAGVRYDRFDYESDYLTPKRHHDLVEQLRATGRLFEDEHGRLALNLEGFKLPSRNPVLVITRANKTSLYVLRDMAYTQDKMKAASDLNLVVLGEDQKLYHRQLQAALKLLGSSAPDPVHYSFVLLGEGSMSTRQGNVVLLEDFVHEAIGKARRELRKRGHADDGRVARAVAYSALKFSFLSVANHKQVRFNWDEAMAFKGRSGPYLLYSHARICSILRKYGEQLPNTADFAALDAYEETELIRLLDELPDRIARALRTRSPHVIAEYTFTIAKQFSMFYDACPILRAASPLREARLLLAEATRQVLANCLGLMGIDALERM